MDFRGLRVLQAASLQRGGWCQPLWRPIDFLTRLISSTLASSSRANRANRLPAQPLPGFSPRSFEFY